MLTNQQWLTFLEEMNDTLKQKLHPRSLNKIRYNYLNIILYEMWAVELGLARIMSFPHQEYTYLHGKYHVTYKDVYNIVTGLE